MVAPRINTIIRDTLIPSNGTIIYNTDINDFEVFDDSVWKILNTGSGSGSGVTGAANGLSLLSGTVVELGGSLYKETIVNGNNQELSFGTKTNPLANFYSSSLNDAVIIAGSSSDKGQISLSGAVVVTEANSTLNGRKALTWDANGSYPGIYVEDSAEEIGLYGAQLFDINGGDQQYIQYGHLAQAVSTINTIFNGRNIAIGLTETLTAYDNLIFVEGGFGASTTNISVSNYVPGGDISYGKTYLIKNNSTYPVVITGIGCTIDGQPSITLNSQYEFVRIVLNNSNEYSIIG
jgi:hypothetical protein